MQGVRMLADGWIKVWRKLADSQMWLEKPFSKGQAWIDLLLLATSSDHVSKYKGKDKVYKAGTVHFSLCFLTDRWGWSRNKVYRFINKLQNDGMLEYQGRTSNGTIDRTLNGTISDTMNDTTNDTVLIVVNWALYQNKQEKNGTINGTINDTANGTAKRTSNGTHPKNDIHKNDISKEKNVKNRAIPKTIDDIVPEVDFDGYPPFSEMPCEADGSKRDIPLRVRKLFDGDYGAYYRYMERMYGECSTKQS